jgi:hypothetical protein
MDIHIWSCIYNHDTMMIHLWPSKKWSLWSRYYHDHDIISILLIPSWWHAMIDHHHHRHDVIPSIIYDHDGASKNRHMTITMMMLYGHRCLYGASKYDHMAIWTPLRPHMDPLEVSKMAIFGGPRRITSSKNGHFWPFLASQKGEKTHPKLRPF